MNKEIRNFVFTLVCGVVVALASAVYAQDLTVDLSATITGYGFPLSWLVQRVVIVPGASPTYELQAAELAIDLVVWITIALVVYDVVSYIRK
jgi:hypothetical protein